MGPKPSRIDRTVRSVDPPDLPFPDLAMSELFFGIDGGTDAPKAVRRHRRLIAPLLMAVTAFAAGIAVDAVALHVGQSARSASVIVGVELTRRPPRSKTPPTTNLATSMAWGPPTTFDPGHAPQSVSCPSPTFCAAVDDAGRAVVYEDGSWAAPIDVDGAVPISSVSCPNARFCAAVDQAGNAIVYNGSTWSGPVRVDRTTFGELSSVSCASPSFCAAVDGDGNAFLYNGSVWSPPQQVDPQAWSAASRDVASISCPEQGYCVGVDPDGNAFYYIGSSWQQASSIGPAQSASPTKYRNPVACANTMFCAAAENPGAVVAYDGVQWSDPVAIDPGSYLESLSCPSPVFCAAVDGLLPQGFSTGSATGDVFIYDGTHWSEARNIDGAQIIDSISCPSKAMCVAVDESGRAIMGTASNIP